MTCLTAFISSNSGPNLLAPAGILALPVALAVAFRLAARKLAVEAKKDVWPRYRLLTRFVLAITVGAWWATWDFYGHAIGESLLFWILPIIGLGAFLFLAYSTDAVIFNLKWTFLDVLRLTWWRLINFVVPLLTLAEGFDDILRGDLGGCAWIVSAGLIAFCGAVLLRRAEGMKLHEIKASETRNRAFAMGQKLGVNLRRVYVVPAGRGHLTNAFATGTSIGLTDNLGKYLNQREIDFIIAHELAHVEKKHGRNRRLIMIAIFAVATTLSFAFRRELAPLRPILDVLLVIVPLAIFYVFSRRHEYEADRRAIEFTRDPESGVRALMRLFPATRVSMQRSRVAAVFLTHPDTIRRVEAIGRAGAISAEKMAALIRESTPADGRGPARARVSSSVR